MQCNICNIEVGEEIDRTNLICRKCSDDIEEKMIVYIVSEIDGEVIDVFYKKKDAEKLRDTDLYYYIQEKQIK